MRIYICALLLIMQALPCCAAHMHAEKVYQDSWCRTQGGKTEVILFDKARVDCLTSTHAIEFDFATKWGESIGQALYYGTVTNKKPGIVLIMENGSKDNKYLSRVQAVAANHGITVWTMTPADLYMSKTLAAGRNK